MGVRLKDMHVIYICEKIMSYTLDNCSTHRHKSIFHTEIKI